MTAPNATFTNHAEVLLSTLERHFGVGEGSATITVTGAGAGTSTEELMAFTGASTRRLLSAGVLAGGIGAAVTWKRRRYGQ